jgi:hypothetical protein
LAQGQKLTARKRRTKTSLQERKTHLTLTGLLMEGLNMVVRQSDMLLWHPFVRLTLLSSIVAAVLLLDSTPASGQMDRTKQVFEREDAYLTKSATHSFRGAVLVGIDGNIAFESGYGIASEEWTFVIRLRPSFRSLLSPSNSQRLHSPFAGEGTGKRA